MYLVDEFRTSCRCSKCEGECETFKKCKNPKPYKTGMIIRHGLVRRTTCECLCHRDENSSNNIYKISECVINGIQRSKLIELFLSAIYNAYLFATIYHFFNKNDEVRYFLCLFLLQTSVTIQTSKLEFHVLFTSCLI